MTAEQPPAPRLQKVAAIRRAGLYWVGGQGWSPELRLANLYPFKQAAEKARIDLGLDGCELIEIEPVAVEGVEPYPVTTLDAAKIAARPWPKGFRR